MYILCVSNTCGIRYTYRGGVLRIHSYLQHHHIRHGHVIFKKVDDVTSALRVANGISVLFF